MRALEIFCKIFNIHFSYVSQSYSNNGFHSKNMTESCYLYELSTYYPTSSQLPSSSLLLLAENVVKKLHKE